MDGIKKSWQMHALLSRDPKQFPPFKSDMTIISIFIYDSKINYCNSEKSLRFWKIYGGSKKNSPKILKSPGCEQKISREKILPLDFFLAQGNILFFALSIFWPKRKKFVIKTIKKIQKNIPPRLFFAGAILFFSKS